MRTMMRITLDVEAGSKAIADGSLPKVIQSTMKKLKPEAAYFLPQDGCRSCIMVFDLKDTSDIPMISEPFFSQLNARVDFTPVMNVEDLQRGLQSMQSGEQ